MRPRLRPPFKCDSIRISLGVFADDRRPRTDDSSYTLVTGAIPHSGAKMNSPMDPVRKAQVRETLRQLWSHARQSSARIPTKGWIAAATVFAIGVLLMLYSSILKDSSLRVRVQHSARSAQVSIWVDGDLSYSGKVVGSIRKRFGLIPDGTLLGTVSQVIPVSSGRHRIKVRVEPDDGNVEEAVISGEFTGHMERTLLANARGGGLSLSWTGESSSERNTEAAEESSSSSSSLGHYVSWLFLTMAGSLISALTGYAVKELPAILRARSNPEAKGTSAAN